MACSIINPFNSLDFPKCEDVPHRYSVLYNLVEDAHRRVHICQVELLEAVYLKIGLDFEGDPLDLLGLRIEDRIEDQKKIKVYIYNFDAENRVVLLKTHIETKIETEGGNSLNLYLKYESPFLGPLKF